ncbi:MAG: class I SAM-dependent methyltransferase [Verrucomicrobiota bacterium]
MSDVQFPPRPTALAQDILRPLISPGDTVIDATAGNGHDTVFLADCVGACGHVFAFDVQPSALRSAAACVDGAGFAQRVTFVHGSHAGMAQHADAGSVAVVMFNLGYLPGDDHALTTEADETLEALNAAAGLLKSGGILSVICYPGHPAGAVEACAVEQWMEDRAGHGWRVVRYGALGTRRPAPFLLMGKK